MNRDLGVLAVLFVAMALSVPIAARADAVHGAQLARQWCASCHLLGAAPPGTTVPQGPPDLRTEARKLSPDQLRTFLTHPHGPMPDLSLTRNEIRDLVDYLQTLR